MLGCRGVGPASSIIRPSRDTSKILVCRAATSKIRPSPPIFLAMRQHIFQPRPVPKATAPARGTDAVGAWGVTRGGPRDILCLRSPRKVPKRPLAVPLFKYLRAAPRKSLGRAMSSTKKSIQSAYVGSKSMELPMSYFVRIRKHDQILPELNELGFPDSRSAEHEATAAAREILVDAINASRTTFPTASSSPMVKAVRSEAFHCMMFCPKL